MNRARMLLPVLGITYIYQALQFLLDEHALPAAFRKFRCHSGDMPLAINNKLCLSSRGSSVFCYLKQIPSELVVPLHNVRLGEGMYLADWKLTLCCI